MLRFCSSLVLLSFLSLPFSLSAQSITLVQDINPGSGNAQINDLIQVGSQILMMADNGSQGVELWKSGGTSASTSQIKDIYAGITPSYPANFVKMGSYVYFRADHPSYGFELWRTDGTFAGTTLVKDNNPGTADGVFTTTTFDIVASNGLLFLSLDDGAYGRELHVSDGTSAGTIRLLDSYAGSIGTINAAGDPQEITPFGPGVLFSTYDYDLSLGTGSGRELWFSDGTPAGTYQVLDIHPAAGSSYPAGFTVVGSQALFTANDGANGTELWITDGTPGGTMMVKNINPGAGDADISGLTRVGGLVYFFADDGTHGKELWVSDGTPGGTLMVKDISPGAGSSYVSSLGNENMIAYNGLLMFTANDGTNGRELWRSDGTSAGTWMVMDIAPGIQGSFASYFSEANGTLFFYAYEPTTGYEMWATDGTPGRTHLVYDLNPGTASASPSKFTQVGTDLLFTADNGTTGGELYKLDLTTFTLLPVEYLNFSANPEPDQTVTLEWITASEQQNDRFVVERSMNGGPFQEIASLPGAGTSEAPRSYTAKDYTPASGVNAYRLVQTDFDGRQSVSNTVEVKLSSDEIIRVNWSPDTREIFIQPSATDQPVSIDLVDIQGRMVASRSFPAGSNQLTWSLPDLPSGSYVLTVQTHSQRHIQRLVFR